MKSRWTFSSWERVHGWMIVSHCYDLNYAPTPMGSEKRGVVFKGTRVLKSTWLWDEHLYRLSGQRFWKALPVAHCHTSVCYATKWGDRLIPSLSLCETRYVKTEQPLVTNSLGHWLWWWCATLVVLRWPWVIRSKWSTSGKVVIIYMKVMPVRKEGIMSSRWRKWDLLDPAV